MKEFTSQTGGRYTYIDDIMNLQELALAFSSLFDACENFIISGCEVSGSSIGAGFVYINGKVRYFSGTSNATAWPMYIYEKNYTENVSYVDSNDKVGRNVYGCAVSSSVPTSMDDITGQVPQYLAIASDGSSIKLKDAFFGKYALMIDSPFPSQTVKKNVSFEGDISVGGNLSVSKPLSVVSGTSKASMSYDADGNLVIQSKLADKNAYKITVSKDGAFNFQNGDTTMFSVSGNAATFSVQAVFTTLTNGTLTVSDNNIYNRGTERNNGELRLNMLGFNGGSSYFRDTLIGDGKGNVILKIEGSSKTSTFNGDIKVFSSSESPFVLQHSTLSKSDVTLQSYFSWKDKSLEEMAVLGYTTKTDKNLRLQNKIGDLILDNNVYVTGNLFVKNKNVLDTLATSSDMTAALELKANVKDVYTKTEVDNAFLKKETALNTLIETAGGGETGKKSIRDSIGACGVSDFQNAALKSEKFNDIVKNGLPESDDPEYNTKLEERRRELCTNIGAAYNADVPKISKDTGWLTVKSNGTNEGRPVYVRQIGHMVTMIGSVRFNTVLMHATLFTLPNDVDAPTYRIGFELKDVAWGHFEAGGREYIVDQAAVYGVNWDLGDIPFTFTYMV